MLAKRLRFVLPLLLFLATVAFIWSNSMMDAETSSAQSDFVGEIIQEIVDVEKNPFDYIFENRRSVAHFVEFALLGASICLFLVLNLPRRLPLYAIGLLAGFQVAVTDECIQIFVPGRAAELTDLALDCGGIAVGMLCMGLVSFLVLLFQKKTKKKTA